MRAAYRARAFCSYTFTANASISRGAPAHYARAQRAATPAAPLPATASLPALCQRLYFARTHSRAWARRAATPQRAAYATACWPYRVGEQEKRRRQNDAKIKHHRGVGAETPPLIAIHIAFDARCCRTQRRNTVLRGSASESAASSLVCIPSLRRLHLAPLDEI